MKSFRVLATAVACFFALAAASPPLVAESGEGGAGGLVAKMGYLQRHLQKLDLSVQAENAELAGYYIHELEELVEKLAEAGVVYEGHQVGALTESMLTPAIEALETALETGGDADAAVGGLVAQCNACHVTTERPWMKIERARSNPFNQDFSP